MPIRYLDPVGFGENPSFDRFLELYAADQARRQNLVAESEARTTENFSRGIRTGFDAFADAIQASGMEERRARSNANSILLNRFGITLDEAEGGARKGGQSIHQFLNQLEHEQNGEVFGLPPQEQEQRDLLDSQIETINRLAITGEFYPDSVDGETGNITNSLDAQRAIERLEAKKKTYQPRWHKPPTPTPSWSQKLKDGIDLEYLETLPDGNPLPYPVLLGTDRNGTARILTEFKPTANKEAGFSESLYEVARKNKKSRDADGNEVVPKPEDIDAEYRRLGGIGLPEPSALPVTQPEKPAVQPLQPKSEPDEQKRASARAEAIEAMRPASQKFIESVKGIGPGRRMSSVQKQSLKPQAGAFLRVTISDYGSYKDMPEDVKKAYNEAKEILGL